MPRDYSGYREHMQTLHVRLGSELRGPMAGFHSLEKSAMVDGALNCKTKQLMALAIAITLRGEGCLIFHLQDALAAGASRAEILETIGVAVLMGGGPATVYGAMALEMLDQLETEGIGTDSQRSYGP